MFAYGGLMKCARCGGAITAEITTKHLASGEIKDYTYYHCTGFRVGPDGQKCKRKYIQEAVLDGQFEQAVKALHFDGDFYDLIVQELTVSHNEEIELYNRNLERLRKRKDQLTRMIEEAWADKLAGEVPTELWQAKSAELRAEFEVVEQRLADLSDGKLSYYDDGLRILELARRAYSWYIEQTPPEKRRLLQVLLSNCTLDGSTLHYSYKKPFDLIAKGSLFSTGRGGRIRTDGLLVPNQAL